MIYLDVESYSECDLRKAGGQKYARDPSTEVIVAQYAVDEDEPTVVDCSGRHVPPALRALLEDPQHTWAIHNSAFDRVLLEHVWGVVLPPERILDTMIQAYAHSLPGALDKVGDALGVEADSLKDKRGAQLIQLFCKPLGKNRKLHRASRDTHPEEWAEFLAYAKQDIVAMRVIHKKLPTWNFNIGHREHTLWCVDQRLNDRGFAVDTALCVGAQRAAAQDKARLDAAVSAATDGAITTTSQRQALLDATHGALPDLRASTIRAALAGDELDGATRELIALRLEGTKTSTAKYTAALAAVCDDDRLRGSLQFGGAPRTMRWAGRLLQMQNPPRPSREYSARAYEALCGSIANGSIALAGDVMQACSDAVRGLMVAPAGKKLIAADLSNIEGRVLAWLAGERWKLDAFAEIDRGVGEDMYKRAHGAMYGVDPKTVTKEQRQAAKVPELACGFGGGCGAFVTFAAGYGTDLDALAATAHTALPADTISNARSLLAWHRLRGRDTQGLPEETWVAVQALVTTWRNAHPQTVVLWADCDAAFRRATRDPGVTFRAGEHLAFRRDGAWLRMRLPSGRYVCYLHPRIEEDDSLSYQEVNPVTRRWARQRTYGGMIAQGATQATARDIFAHGVILADAAGYLPVMLVHDEAICETPDTEQYTHEKLASMLASVPAWAPGIPLAASGFEGSRYRKE